MVPAMTGTPPPQAQTPPFAAIVLAGGQSRRMGGGDKALLDLGGRPMVAHVIDRLGVVPTAISANGDPDRFAAFGLPVLPDTIPGWLGPLAGVLAGMGWAAAQGIPRIVTAAADSPFFPRDLAARLAAAAAPVAMSVHEGDDHPAFAAWDVSLCDTLRQSLADGDRRVRAVMERLGVVRIAFAGRDPFFNVNTPEDLTLARRWLATGDVWT